MLTVFIRLLCLLCYCPAVTIPQPGTQTVRVGPPPGTTILRHGGSTNIAGKQIITVHKGGNQPQIVTLVKTTQGMAVATVSLLILVSFLVLWFGVITAQWESFQERDRCCQSRNMPIKDKWANLLLLLDSFVVMKFKCR